MFVGGSGGGLRAAASTREEHLLHQYLTVYIWQAVAHFLRQEER